MVFSAQDKRERRTSVQGIKIEYPMHHNMGLVDRKIFISLDIS